MKIYISVIHFICLVYCTEEKNISFNNFSKPLDSINTNYLSFEKKLIVNCIKGWQNYSYSNSFLNCQFHPSCSNYFAKAVIQDGSIFGSIKGADRLIRCNTGAYYYFAYDTYKQKYSIDKRMIDDIYPLFNPKQVKNSNLALFFSLIPGLGRTYTGRYIDGLYSFLTIFLFSQLSYDQFHKENHLVSAIYGSIAITFWSGDFYGAWRTTKVKK
ncbi:MAG: hypothetical protein CMG07_04385 [Candidatus Marinimicrobia bacterium]|nr:hypothetical protein [Candidatus Neomarinimicrobiota bacterium]|tara:strand:+ start:1309 stop:1947 length:639 start_codon:yes stop_codon:yes gene_type:complete